MTINQIEYKIKNHKRGKIFFLDDFAKLGTPEAIKKSLPGSIPRSLTTREFDRA